MWRSLSTADVVALIGDQDAHRSERVYVAARRSEMIGDIRVYVEEDGSAPRHALARFFLASWLAPRWYSCGVCC